MKYWQFGKMKEEASIIGYVRTFKQLCEEIQRNKDPGSTNIHKAIKNMDATELVITVPPKPPATITEQDAAGNDVVIDNSTAQEIWGAEMKVLIELRMKVNQYAKSMYGDIYSLCSKDVKELLEKRRDWDAIDTNK